MNLNIQYNEFKKKIDVQETLLKSTDWLQNTLIIKWTLHFILHNIKKMKSLG